jgi:DNA-directed RNA polymerase specialized sigma24 family protein
MSDDDLHQPAEDVAPLVYNELRRLASAYMRRERPGQTLQATALVHEAFIRLAASGAPWTDKRHFVRHRRALDAPDSRRTGAGARSAEAMGGA